MSTVVPNHYLTYKKNEVKRLGITIPEVSFTTNSNSVMVQNESNNESDK
jgi:hypothetical protein